MPEVVATVAVVEVTEALEQMADTVGVDITMLAETEMVVADTAVEVTETMVAVMETVVAGRAVAGFEEVVVAMVVAASAICHLPNSKLRSCHAAARSQAVAFH